MICRNCFFLGITLTKEYKKVNCPQHIILFILSCRLEPYLEDIAPAPLSGRGELKLCQLHPAARSLSWEAYYWSEKALIWGNFTTLFPNSRWHNFFNTLSQKLGKYGKSANIVTEERQNIILRILAFDQQNHYKFVKSRERWS